VVAGVIARPLEVLILTVSMSRVVGNNRTVVQGKSMRSWDLADRPPCVVVAAVPIGPSRRLARRLEWDDIHGQARS
jgi:hypothetical protein